MIRVRTSTRLAAGLLVAALGLSTAPASSLAQTAGESTIDRINRFIHDLKPRSGRVQKPREIILPDGRRIVVDDNASVQLRVQFAFGSGRLTQGARVLLSDLGAALNSADLRDARYFVGGHTDAVGSDYYNLDLSKRRASSVVNFLVGQKGVASGRLLRAGFGETMPLPGTRHRDARNRRVEVSLIISDDGYQSPSTGDPYDTPTQPAPYPQPPSAGYDDSPIYGSDPGYDPDDDGVTNADPVADRQPAAPTVDRAPAPRTPVVETPQAPAAPAPAAPATTGATTGGGSGSSGVTNSLIGQ